MSLEIESLVKAIEMQTKSINALVKVNQDVLVLLTAVVDQMASESVDSSGEETYLNGLSISSR